ncbi:hypothetical protein D3C87_1975060 [compost metagenome]
MVIGFPLADPCFGASAVEVARLIQVLARAEGAVAGAGHHQRADGRVRGGLAQHLHDFRAHRRMPGIEALWPIQRQHRYVANPFQFDEVHGVVLCKSVRRRRGQ